MYREERLIVDHIISLVHAEHPEYGLDVQELPDYVKIYMPSGYTDSAILAMVHFGPKSRYIKLKPYGVTPEQQKRFSALSDKKGIVKLARWDDVKMFDDLYVPMADHLWKIYEIEKFREMAKNRKNSPLLEALGIKVDFSSSGNGISVGLTNKDG